MRFSFDAKIKIEDVKSILSLSYDRDQTWKKKNYKVSEIEAEMHFYEFLDIEWDRENRKFLLKPHFRLEKSNKSTLSEALMTRPSSSIGDLGYTPGQIFQNRKELAESGIHRPHQAGIWNAGGDFAVSIIVSGGYVDDTDNGTDLLYTGQGGRDQSGKQSFDQVLTKGNLGLFNSMKGKVPVRVTRGYQTEFGPDEGLSL